MKTNVFVMSLLALTAVSSSAFALTVENQDKAAYTLKVTPTGGKEKDLAIKASDKAEVDCKSGCVLQLGKESKTVDGKAVTVMIKDGKFA